MQSCCRKTNYGFTLLEMILVLIIGSILTAIAIPAFHNWAPKYRVNGAARQVFSEMMAARAKAISEGNDYVITFNTGNNTYTIHDNDDKDDPPVQDTGEAVKTVNIANDYPGIGYDSGNPLTFIGSQVTFKPSGLVESSDLPSDTDGGDVYFKPTEDTTRQDRQRRINVRLTGRIRLYKHTGSDWE